MRTNDIDILIVPGWSDSGPDHWQSRWERSLPTARRVEQDDWVSVDRDRWVGRLIDAIAVSSRPVVLVAHSLGVGVIAHAAAKLPASSVQGAFLAAPADVERASEWPSVSGVVWSDAHGGFAPLPGKPLPFKSVLIASSDDPFCSHERAILFADAWGCEFTSAGEAGHINIESGHGPWPEGLLRFGQFLRSL